MKHLKTAFSHVRRAPYQALAALAIIFLTAFIVSTSALRSYNSEQLLRQFEEKPQATAFFKDEFTTQQVEELKDKLNQTGKVSEIKYVSKEEALSIYREENKDDPLLLEMVTANILPASLEVSAVKSAFLSELVEILKQEPIVEDVSFQEDITVQLTNWVNAVRKENIESVAMFILVSVLIVFVIVGMTIAVRKEEIEILRILGASGAYIWAPFLIEGAFYGIIGAFLAWGAVSAMLYFQVSFLIHHIVFLPTFLLDSPYLLPPPWFLLALLGGEVIIGIFIGVIGSLLAVRRYL